MATQRHHHPVTCILPPDLLARIARVGDADQRAAALRTLTRDQSLRAFRAQATLLGETEPDEKASGLDRTIFDCGHAEDLDAAEVARSEGDDTTGDLAVDEAYDGLGDTYRLYSEVYQRDSIDGEGLPLKGYVHYGEDYDNAFWDGQQMIFGDGDAQLFNRFTIAVDVIGHELAHGVTENEAGLAYVKQSGALNESLSDVFGSLVKQYALGQPAEAADWLIGAGLIADAPDQALRSMRAPGTAYDHPLLGKDPQPATMADYVSTTSDNGGVHINSGIPNHAFYLAATKIGGNAWGAAGAIWYETLRGGDLKPRSQFVDFVSATLAAAVRLGYEEGSVEHNAVVEAWTEVGLAP